MLFPRLSHQKHSEAQIRELYIHRAMRCAHLQGHSVPLKTGSGKELVMFHGAYAQAQRQRQKRQVAHWLCRSRGKTIADDQAERPEAWCLSLVQARCRPMIDNIGSSPTMSIYSFVFIWLFGGRSRARTCDPLIKR